MWDTVVISPLINVLLFIYNLIGQNFGVAVILFTILIKLATHPLTAKQIKSTKALSDLQQDPEWLEMQKKYKNDKNKLAEVQMALYKKRGVSPFSSCLPTFIQLPIIIGLYQTIIQTMGNAPLQLANLVSRVSPWLTNVFKFIPWLKDPITLIPLNSQFLWMDLGKPERLYIPGISFGIPVLTILVVISSFLQSKLMTPPSSDPQSKQMSGMMNATSSDPQARQMNTMMSIYMPLLMGWFAYSFASGLALYFLVSNIVTIFQYGALGKLNLDNLFPPKKIDAKAKNDKARSTQMKSIASKTDKK
jgi:YidC/Oxa1 family membrane protein insertase